MKSSRPIHPQHLMSAQEVVASALTGTDVSVVFDAETPWADLTNKVIHLRPLPDHLSEEAVEDVRGDCDHEVGHIRFTDPNVLGKVKDPFLKKVVESIEDGRIERMLGREWFGCGENLEKSTSRAVSRIAAAKSSDPLNQRVRALCCLSLISSGWGLDRAVEALGGDIDELCRGVAPLENAIRHCESTSEVVDLASQIVAIWSWDPISETGGKSREHTLAKELEGMYVSPAMERKHAVQRVDGGRLGYRAYTEHDKTEAIRKPSFGVDRLYGVFFDGVRKTAPTLRRRLLMKFQSTGKRYRSLAIKGELDGRNLWRFGIDDNRFRRKLEPVKLNRAVVSILVDCSASMTRAAREATHDGEPLVFRTRLFIAAQAAAAVSAVLDSLQISNEVLAFTTSKRTPPADKRFDRVRSLRHLVIKPYNRPFHSCRANFISLAFFEHCSENIDGEAVLWAARRMVKKPNHGDQPVLIVFSDGEPASLPESGEVLARHMTNAISQIEKAGITVFGVGVGSDAVRKFYTNAVVVTDVSNLLTAFYDLIEKVLRGRQTVRV